MFTQLIRIGRDSELRYTQSGKAVCSIAAAYDVGYGDNKKTQWIDCALWEKRAESLVQYLTKGQQCMVTLDDVHIEMYEGQNGPKAKLKARVIDLKLCGQKPDRQSNLQQNNYNQGRQQNNQQHNGNQGQQQNNQASDDFIDDIPF
jgi:single-strand DNA-binding protein